MTIIIPVIIVQIAKWIAVITVMGLAIVGVLALFYVRDLKLWK